MRGVSYPMRNTRTIKAQLATKIREKLFADAEANEKIDFADKPEPADS